MSLFCLFCCYALCLVINSAYNIIASINFTHMLNGTNFKSWQENIMIVLGVIDLDLTLRVTRPSDLIDQNFSAEKREVERWDLSNCMSWMIRKHAILKAFRGTMSEKVTTAKEFIEEIEKRFAKNDKAKTSTLLGNHISMRYKGKGNIREYIMEMSHLTSKLKALKLELPRTCSCSWF